MCVGTSNIVENMVCMVCVCCQDMWGRVIFNGLCEYPFTGIRPRTVPRTTEYPLEQSDSGILFLYDKKLPASNFAPKIKKPLPLCSWGYSVRILFCMDAS